MNSQTTDYGTTFQNVDLQDAVARLQELDERRFDLITDIDNLRYTDQGFVIVTHPGTEPYMAKPNKVGHSHIATKMGVPTKYWQKMIDGHDELAAHNFNYWKQLEGLKARDGGNAPRQVFFRGYRDEKGSSMGNMRALLSNSYLPYDNLTLLMTVLKTCNEIASDRGIKIHVDKCDLSEKKLFVRFICKDVEKDAADYMKGYRDPNQGTTGGDGVSKKIFSGFVVSNSEVGAGKLVCAPRLVVGACRNGLIWTSEQYDRTHLGSKMDKGFYSPRTHKANYELIESQMIDHVNRFLSEDFLGKTIEQVEQLDAWRLAHPANAVRNIGHEFKFSEEEQEGILNHFMLQGRSQTAFDIAQAITSYAQTREPETRYAMESSIEGILGAMNKCDRDLVLAN